MKKTTFRSDFEKEVYTGLTSFPKHLSSKYFYDTAGDKLFQEIMQLPEYYLTSCEFDILQQYKAEIATVFDTGRESFDLIELGAGDGKKTKILLKHLVENHCDFSYRPIDISDNALQLLAAALRQELPELNVQPLQGTYFGVLERLASYNQRKKVIMFLGSNIGNLLHRQAVNFLRHLNTIMNSNDLLFIGFDQKKDPQVILDAYNDKTGVTARFNKNILLRINAEMQADFDPGHFLHWETYDPETGTAKSFLVAKKAHNVSIRALDMEVHFKKWETIHTEISQKYDDDIVEWLAGEAGLNVRDQFSDARNYYKNYIFTKK
ncbi:MAG: L-histidine N(alpha)-methyltransferase [Sinomicrobium sp.]|nr:L-histidine N(alpha)-methyltransferase [Sinomicrobium sp.]